MWLNRHQLSILFDRDIKTIGKHINNALKEELDGLPVIANFATTATDGKTYIVDYYNLEMITSIGYLVKEKIKLEHYDDEFKSVVATSFYNAYSKDTIRRIL